MRHCDLDTSIMERAMAERFFTEWSVVVVCGVFNSLLFLVPLLEDPQAQSIFVRSCVITHALSRQLPILRVTLRAVLAMTSGRSIPTAVEPIFKSLSESEELVRDVPTAYQLPHSEEIRKLLQDDNADTTGVGVDLSLVIAAWSAISTSSTLANEV